MREVGELTRRLGPFAVAALAVLVVSIVCFLALKKVSAMLVHSARITPGELRLAGAAPTSTHVETLLARARTLTTPNRPAEENS